MTRSDPYTPQGVRQFECTACMTRVETDETVERCPECGAPMRNVSVPRE